LEELRERLSKALNKLTPELVSSVSGWYFILEALSVAKSKVIDITWRGCIARVCVIASPSKC
jgi:hypothetical protein